MQAWLDTIEIPKLLQWAPSGLFVGCGGTAEYLSYLMRIKPSTEDEIWEITRQHYWYDSATGSLLFTPEQLEEALSLIRECINTHEYVQVSFSNDSTEDLDEKRACCEEIVGSIKTFIFNKPPAELFDHAFILVKKGDSILRLESYLGEYGPRYVPWNNYESDLRDLFKNPHLKWKEIFGVDCNPKYDLHRVTITVNN